MTNLPSKAAAANTSASPDTESSVIMLTHHCTQANIACVTALLQRDHPAAGTKLAWLPLNTFLENLASLTPLLQHSQAKQNSRLDFTLYFLG